VISEPRGAELGRIRVTPPGPNSLALARRLREVECRNVTYVGPNSPIFLTGGAGANLEDADGNLYVDLTAAFAVSSVGHSNERVAAAIARQSAILLHGMGDVYPTPEKVELARQLCELTPGDGAKRVIFATSGSEAVEAALKTAAVATGKPGVLAFSGAYHGLTYGALEVTDRAHFRSPFSRQLGGFSRRASFADRIELTEAALDRPDGAEVGAVIFEPILGRGGIVEAPDEWLRALRDICNRRGLLLIADEIFTGFGRTGRWFACEWSGVVPDLICVGKGMAGGFPISACVGAAEVMDRWPESRGEAIHTTTYLGHPAGCAAAIACIAELRERHLVERAARIGSALDRLLQELKAGSESAVGAVRGRGLMWGLEIVDGRGQPDAVRAASIVNASLARGVIVLTGGPHRNVIEITPPLVITQRQLEFAVGVLRAATRA